jgi:hypothetical protein
MRSTQIIFVLAIVLLSPLAIAQGQGNGPPPPPGDVNVINTPDVNVANMPDVNVANSPDVNVANTPDVNVLSMPEITIGTDVRIPYQITVDQPTWTTNSVNIIVEVPSGNRMVIEHISASAFMHPEVELSTFTISPTVNNLSATHIFALPETAPGFTGSNTYGGGQSVRLYTDQSFVARFTKVSVGGPLTLGSARITVSGYLIPFTSPSLAP